MNSELKNNIIVLSGLKDINISRFESKTRKDKNDNPVKFASVIFDFKENNQDKIGSFVVLENQIRYKNGKPCVVLHKNKLTKDEHGNRVVTNDPCLYNVDSASIIDNETKKISNIEHRKLSIDDFCQCVSGRTFSIKDVWDDVPKSEIDKNKQRELPDVSGATSPSQELESSL